MKGINVFQAARHVICLFSALVFESYAQAQSYRVGVPVCDTVFIGNESGACSPYDVLLVGLGPSLIPYVTGLNFQIVITEVSGKVWSTPSDSLQVGAILTIPAQTDSGVKIFFALNSTFKFITRITGTPTVPYEEYKCGTTYSHTTMVCGNTLTYHGDGAICHVQPTTSVEERNDSSLPVHFQLLQNYPNPFNPQTTIEYALPKASFVKLQIFDTLGQEVRTLLNEFQQPGFKSAIWDGRNNHGQLAPSGVYLYKIVADGFTQSSKSILLK